jgi:hypothetical protein
MDADKAVYYLLRTNQAVVQAAGSRIWPVAIPVGERRPAIAYRVVTDVDAVRVLKRGATSLIRERVQVTVHHDDQAALKLLVRAVDRALTGQSGAVNGVQLQYIHRELVGPILPDGTDPDHWSRPIDFMVTLTEAN